MDPRNQPAQDDEDLLRDIRKILDDRHDADDPYERGFADKLYEDCEDPTLQTQQPPRRHTIAVFDTSAGVFKAVLFSTEAPQAVQNFTTLAQQGFYNGLTVTRVEKDFVVEAGQGADGKGTTIWNGNRFSAETTDKLHHYSGALCAAADASGDCASVFYVMETLPGSSSVTQELIDQMNAAGWRADVVNAYQTAGGAPNSTAPTGTGQSR